MTDQISVFDAYVVVVSDGDGRFDYPNEIFITKVAANEFATKLIKKLKLKDFDLENIVKVMSLAEYFTHIAQLINEEICG